MKIIYSVSDLTNLIKNALEPKFSEIWVSGEISNLKFYSSGHAYLTLKDEYAQIRAVIFNYEFLDLKFRLEDGLKVVVFGRLSVYPKFGEYRIVITHVEPLGKGALQLAFEQLKEKLAREGLFDQSRKKRIPTLIRRVGIVTSIDGAALKDILTIFKTKNAKVEVYICHAKVQGDDAKYEISEAIEYLNTYYPMLDVILVGRGGGSIEDLWAFNEELTARAIANSKIPIISCVGHEIDYTIADFVADLRMPTPTAAAEYIVKSQCLLEDKISILTTRMYQSLERSLTVASLKLNSISKSRVFIDPLNIIRKKAEKVQSVSSSLLNVITKLIDEKSQELNFISEKLGVLSPLNILSRGYAIVWKEKSGSIVKDADELEIDDILKIRFYKGEIKAKVI